MKKTVLFILCLGWGTAVNISHAIDLKQSKITQVVNDVKIISASNETEKSATVNDLFSMPDILRTGPSSRAELVAQDQTVTRVGANTIFSFDPASRSIDLKQGSLLFHSEHGKGGGTIHTGSATASVLGTTLIVTTTPSGGLKVLDLEGSVEVKFLNGLKQHLGPGQMTFVLPGGNQLAPIIVFRLDDLTKNSLLVKGFNNPLASMPFIEEQIQKQLNLIKNGRYTDTGLLVGNDANASQVQVLDVNTLQSALNKSGVNSAQVREALASNATINQPSLTDASIPSPPNHVFVNQPFILPVAGSLTGQSFVGFAADNIYFNTEVNTSPELAGPSANAILPPLLSVDMSPYTSLPEFDFVAANNMDFEGSVDFDESQSEETRPEGGTVLSLVAGKQIILSTGVSVTAEVDNLDLESGGAFTLEAASIGNSVGNIAMSFGSSVTVENGASITAAGSLQILAGGDFTMTDPSVTGDSLDLESRNGAMTINNCTLTANSSGLFESKNDINVGYSVLYAGEGSGSVTFNSTHGSVNLNNNYVQAYYLTVNSGDGILLSGVGQHYTCTGNSGTMKLTARNLVEVENASLSTFAAVNMAAHTINLYDVFFAAGSVDNFGCATGGATVNQSGNVNGDVNFHTCSYGETAITSTSQINFTSGPSSAAGLNVYALGHNL